MKFLSFGNYREGLWSNMSSHHNKQFFKKKTCYFFPPVVRRNDFIAETFFFNYVLEVELRHFTLNVILNLKQLKFKGYTQ